MQKTGRENRENIIDWGRVGVFGLGKTQGGGFGHISNSSRLKDQDEEKEQLADRVGDQVLFSDGLHTALLEPEKPGLPLIDKFPGRMKKKKALNAYSEMWGYDISATMRT